jgi:hypothetical protein
MLRGSKTGLSDLPLDSTRNLPATRYVIERYTRPATPPTDRQTPSSIPSILSLQKQTKPKSPSTPLTAWHSKRKCTSTTTAHTLSWGAAALQVDKYLPTYLSISRGCSSVWRMLMVPKGRTRGLEKRGVRLRCCCCTRVTTFRTWWQRFLLLSILNERCQSGERLVPVDYCSLVVRTS